MPPPPEGVECVVVGVECVGVGVGVECVGVGVECVGVGVACVVVVAIGAGVLDVEVLCALWCAALCFLTAFFAVVVVVGVVAGATVLELDEDDPQPAATSARLTRSAVTIDSRLICMLDKG
jgi:hypothetical protein